ncbi:unnamed protein product [Ambrosiozyma monospora]|uniref:Unnamed protein product n=1 Tax=Ambrosiozyma monospora TaxID=43982 RepID=A0ACB5SV88_AMBMO|nr:unnamed protein product [Ambrosiozyma monospora]
MDSTTTTISSAFDNYGYSPDLGGNAFFAVCWGLNLIAEIILNVKTKQLFLGVCFPFGCLIECIGFICRSLSSHNTSSLGLFLMNLIGSVLGPVFILAGIYSSFGMIVQLYNPIYSLVKPINYRRIFIVLDVLSFLAQFAGDGMASQLKSVNMSPTPGFQVLAIGRILQLVSMTIFIIFVSIFFGKLHKAHKRGSLKRETEIYAFVRESTFFKLMVSSLLFAVFCIYIRTIYRVAALSGGYQNGVMIDEKMFFGLDSAMVLFASILISGFYPGVCFQQMTDSDDATKMNFPKATEVIYSSNQTIRSSETNKTSNTTDFYELKKIYQV